MPAARSAVGSAGFARGSGTDLPEIGRTLERP
jgi:hypothetical protein